MYKKGLNVFCRKVNGSRDIELNAFSKMAATLIPIRPRQSRFRLERHPPTSPEIIPCSLFFTPYITYLLGCRTTVKLKLFGEKLQSSCRRVNFDLTILDSKRPFHRVFDRHYLDIKHIE